MKMPAEKTANQKIEGSTMASKTAKPVRQRIPRDKENDYTKDMAAKRRAFVREQTGAELSHVGQYSFDPSALPGNIESFMGVAQVPIGLAALC